MSQSSKSHHAKGHGHHAPHQKKSASESYVKVLQVDRILDQLGASVGHGNYVGQCTQLVQGNLYGVDCGGTGTWHQKKSRHRVTDLMKNLERGTVVLYCSNAGWYAGTKQHVAIFLKASGSGFEVVDQNWGDVPDYKPNKKISRHLISKKSNGGVSDADAYYQMIKR
jgi:hypothetical protein